MPGRITVGNINVARWLAGGVAAAAVMFVCEGVGSALYLEDMQVAMAAHALSMDMTPLGFILPVVASLLAGLTLVFLYAAARTRFGPGPRTAVIVATAMWVGGYLLSLLGYVMMGLFSAGLIVTWSIIGYVEMVLGALLGGWIYREG
jgi:hypothetical protein